MAKRKPKTQWRSMCGLLWYGIDCFDDKEHWERTLTGIVRALNETGFVPPPKKAAKKAKG